MKLNYRDKVILGIVLAIAIFLAGYFLLIKPKNQQIKDDNKKLDKLKVTETDYKQKIAQIDPLKTNIETIVNDTNEITAKFVAKDNVSDPVRLDQFMQHFANDNDIRITSLAAGDMKESKIPYYYAAVANEIGSGLRTVADINGDYQSQLDQANAEKNQLSEREVGGVIQTQYGIEAIGTRENLWKLMEEIENRDDTIIIDSVSYKLEKKAEAEDPDNLTEEEENNIEMEDTVKINMVISIYSVYDLPQPNYEHLNVDTTNSKKK